MTFRKLRDHEGTPLVALETEALEIDGVIDSDGGIPDDQRMSIERVGEGAYLVRAVRDGEVAALSEVFR